MVRCLLLGAVGKRADLIVHLERFCEAGLRALVGICSSQLSYYFAPHLKHRCQAPNLSRELPQQCVAQVENLLSRKETSVGMTCFRRLLWSEEVRRYQGGTRAVGTRVQYKNHLQAGAPLNVWVNRCQWVALQPKVLQVDERRNGGRNRGQVVASQV